MRSHVLKIGMQASEQLCNIAGPWRTMITDCVVIYQPDSAKILCSPAKKDILGIMEGYMAELADPTAVYCHRALGSA